MRDYLEQLFTNSTISSSTASTAFDQKTTPGSPPRGNQYGVALGTVVNANATLAKNVTIVAQSSAESAFTNATVVSEIFTQVFASASTTTPEKSTVSFRSPYRWLRFQVMPDSGITCTGVNIACEH